MLTNVHDALARSQETDRNKVPLVNANFKCHPIKKEVAERICVKNGTTLSGFLRECVEGLVKDYVGDKANEALSEPTEG